jgi:hypothetical protein
VKDVSLWSTEVFPDFAVISRQILTAVTMKSIVFGM